MPANDPSYYPHNSRPVAPGSQFHTFLPQEKAAEDIFGPASVPHSRPLMPPFELAPSIQYPSTGQYTQSGCPLAIAVATDEANTLQDMLKELRLRLQPVLRDAEQQPAVGSADTEKKSMSPMALEIRGISSSLGVSKHIINDILARLEV